VTLRSPTEAGNPPKKSVGIADPLKWSGKPVSKGIGITAGERLNLCLDRTGKTGKTGETSASCRMVRRSPRVTTGAAVGDYSRGWPRASQGNTCKACSKARGALLLTEPLAWQPRAQQSP